MYLLDLNSGIFQMEKMGRKKMIKEERFSGFKQAIFK